MKNSKQRVSGKMWSLLLVGLLFGPCAVAQGSDGLRQLITEATVAEFLNQSGMHVSAWQIHLPMPLKTVSANPTLEIISAAKTSSDVLQLRLRCQSLRDCLAFDAQINSSDPAMVQSLNEHSVEAGRRTSPRAFTPHATGSSAISGAREHLVASGDAVMLIVSDAVMQIHLRVVAIDSGTAGSTVRVCTTDRKKVFRATVLDGSTVLGVTE